jgi:hypothetical protein
MPRDNSDEYKLYLAERDKLIDAARESARTFDQAVLAFGSAVFGFSIAFLKDVVAVPARWTLKWLAGSWFAFSLGLLAILLSFLFSHRACMFEIQVGGEALGNGGCVRKKNWWSAFTNWCNVSSVVLLFVGILCWSTFALKNLSQGESTMNKVQTATEKKGYVPAPPPAKTSEQQSPTQAPPSPAPEPDSQK